MKEHSFFGGVLLGCFLTFATIGFGSVIRDSIRLGVLTECLNNHKTVVYGNEWLCSFKKEGK